MAKPNRNDVDCKAEKRNGEFDSFEDLAKKLSKVPKEEVDE